jgi:2-amino-4-hydroxy-6-hydroxymethyldihydropteridine diphosphokinase
MAVQRLQTWGQCQFSNVYEIPCRDDKGQDYYNLAALLNSELTLSELNQRLKALEQSAGRVRPSHHITLDIDIIAVGDSIDQLQIVAKRLPLAFDVWLPLSELWSTFPHDLGEKTEKMNYTLVHKALK